VIGVEEVKGTVFGIPQDNFIVIPLKTYSIDYGALVRQRSLYFTRHPRKLTTYSMTPWKKRDS